MSTAIQGAKFLFSMLQHVLTDQKGPGLRLHHLVKSALRHWAKMSSSLAQYPVPIAALVPKAPSYVGAVDASGIGCGGFWVNTTFSCLPQPIAFRWQFPADIQHLLVSHANPSGTLSNSDFELAAIVAGTAALQSETNTTASTLYIASDNTPAVAWCNKGSPSSNGANAHLLRQLAQLSRVDNCTLEIGSVPGNTNTIADFYSRSFALPNQAFLHQLNERFPVTPRWKLVPLTLETTSRLTSALLRVPSPWESAHLAGELQTTPSTSGKLFATNISLTPPWNSTQTLFPSCKSLVIDTAKAALLPAKLRSTAERWAMPFVP